MEDVCDAEASVRVWLLLLTQIFAYIPDLGTILPPPDDWVVASQDMEQRREINGLTILDYVYPDCEQHMLYLHDYYKAYFMSTTAKEALKSSTMIDSYIQYYIYMKQSNCNNNILLYYSFLQKFLVRSCDVLLRHAKYYSNESYPLFIKYIANINYQLQNLNLQKKLDYAPELILQTNPSTAAGTSGGSVPVNVLMEILYYLHNNGQDHVTINISELFLHLLNECGYPYHNTTDTIPLILLCSDILNYKILYSRVGDNELGGVSASSSCVYTSSPYFYTNDMTIIIDLTMRELVNLPTASNQLISETQSQGSMNRRGSVASLSTSCLGINMASFNYKVKVA